uniref:Fatty acid desaturase domain-containing protein n=1 Tax=Pyrodinium bahamense TaxID=73915 RepID=A0A7S0FRK1_9DINO|mmetsp:Transcript_43778/g.121652  ORF Transcript_43778/g.121652 Transcript_43778/m.121652 type:complete len:454 (+) Transcript_43778:59-1420(+)
MHAPLALAALRPVGPLASGEDAAALGPRRPGVRGPAPGRRATARAAEECRKAKPSASAVGKLGAPLAAGVVAIVGVHRRSGPHSSHRRRTLLRYHNNLHVCEPGVIDADTQAVRAGPAALGGGSPAAASALPGAFQHPPRAEREPRALPFSSGEGRGELVIFPKALFPWSPEYGGRPWAAWTETHKVRLLFVGAVHLGALAAPLTFSWGAFHIFVALSAVCTLGITLSYHRQLSHRAFATPKWLEYLLAYFGCLAVEGAPIGWVRMHRHHHVHSDKEDDVHSPLDGFWWSHMGFMFDASTTERLSELDNVRDLSSQEFYRLMNNAEFYVLTSVLLPIALLYVLGGLPYVVWGFCLRTVYIWHVNWSVNSIGHIWGYQSYKSNDNSQNNWVFGLLGFGDGWHNNHHAFPRSCRHGFEWWELDLNWQLLQFMNACGLAWDLQLPSETRKQKLALH